MPYIGNTIRAADDYRLIDDISSSFNGSTTSFALQVAGSAPVPFPKSPQQVLISVNGVIQEPDPSGSSGFNLVGTNIVFSSAPTNGHAFFGIIYATADYLNAGGNFPAGSLGAPSITFIGDENTGLYRKGGGSIGFVADATEIANTDSNGLTISSGSLIIPGDIIHSGDSNTKIRFSDTDQIKLETGSVQKLRLDNTEVVVNDDGADVDFRVEGDTDTNLIRVDAATDHVGVGTAAARCKFEVYDSTVSAAFSATDLSTWRVLQIRNNIESNTGTAAGISFGGDGSSDTETAGICGISTNNSGGVVDLAFLTASGNASTERMRIDSSGRVGIGTTSPDSLGSLTVSQSATAEQYLTLINESNWGYGIGIQFKQALASGGSVITSGKILSDWVSTNDSIMSFYTTGSSTSAERMRIDSSGRVLIGTTTEGNGDGDDLTIASSGRTGITIRSADDDYGNIFFSDATSGASEYVGAVQYYHADNSMRFKTSSNDRLTIDSSGRLLVGTTTSRTINSHIPKLQISGTDYSTSTVSIINNTNDSNGAYLFLGKQRSGSAGGSTVVQNGDLLGQIRFSGADGTDMENPAAYIEAKVDGSPASNDMPARVSVYTNSGSGSPNERIRIEPTGALTFVGASSRAADTNGICCGSGNSIDINYTEYFYVRSGNSAETLRADNNGDVAIGTTNTTHRLTVISQSGSQQVGQFLAGASSYGTTTLQSACNTNTANNSYNHFLCSVNGVADKFRVRDSGNCQNTNNSFGALSDETLKENIVDAGSQWDDIKNIKVRKFNFKEGVDPEKPTLLGVIAQEAELVCPNLVESDKQLQEGVEKEYKSFKYSVLYMKAIKCLQEAQAKIETLETKVAALEAA